MTEKQVTAISGLAEDFKEAVQQIEGSQELTKDHYSDYLVILNSVSDKKTAIYVMFALVQAGANANGVGSAFKILYP